MRRAAWACVIVLSGCELPECVTPSYSESECRVMAENELARLRTVTGVEVRFQDPEAPDATSWDARGLLQEVAPGVVRARVAGAGRFALSFERVPGGADSVELELVNVDPAAAVTVTPPGVSFDVGNPPTTVRAGTIDVSAGEAVWLRGDRDPCPATFRVAVAADIQTNPAELERIVERLDQEAIDAEAAGEPLVAFVLPGDLSESSRDEEFELVADILSRSPVPAAVTAGNHDIYRPLHPYYNRWFGPGNHVFDVCTAHFVMLDTGSGAIARSVEGRLPELLDRGNAEYLVAGMHHPPYPELSGNGWSKEDMAAHLLVELAIADADLVLAGHIHALRDYRDIPVGDVGLRQIVVGTAGAKQGLAAPRYGYVRLRFAGRIEPCFVEVPPPGWADSPNDPLSDELPNCAEP